MKRLLEEVFVTEGVPAYTFVPPPNFNEILLDVRHPGKPVIVEGQSGTGKTTCVRKILERVGGADTATYLSARIASDVSSIEALASQPMGGRFVVDDFHRLAETLQIALADLAKLAAEQGGISSDLPKLILVGINQVGTDLIQLVPDVAKRAALHRILPGTEADIHHLIASGSSELNVEIVASDQVFAESQGDYWLTQQLCQSICAMSNVLETQDEPQQIHHDVADLRTRVVEKLRAAYYPAVKEFCRGRRFRPSNDPYYKVLRLVGQQPSSIVDLNELANSTPEVRGSINNIKERRLSVLLADKPLCGRHFYYNSETKNFAIEDPALFYFLKHLDWEGLRLDCGFREATRDYEYDIAISFAGENRELARHVADQLEILDARVFFDEYFEANFLGKAWSGEFERIFGETSRLVVCLLDVHHRTKIWPTFERECFLPRVAEAEVVPIFLDDTVFPGMPSDIVGIRFEWDPSSEEWRDAAVDQIIFKVMERLG